MTGVLSLGFLLLLAAVAFHETEGTGYWSLRSFSTFVALLVKVRRAFTSAK